MELSQAVVENLPESPVEIVSRGLLYYVHTGRNAWHSTWVTRYSPGCMHTRIDSAIAHAEEKRARGTVFYIRQLPCVVFRSRHDSLLATEINTDNPLAGYSREALEVEDSDFVNYDCAENIIGHGVPLNSVAISFRPILACSPSSKKFGHFTS